ncbi:MAG: hypothetical protein IK066_04275, partial [Kiritimatiellae bacterium]|nr:hypothetical protein [Kiritimatiellia bacterium]
EAAAEGARGRLERAGGRLAGPARASVEMGKARVAHASKLLEALSPLGVLARGYTMTFGEDGRVVRGAGVPREGSRLRTRWADGERWSVVEGRGTVFNAEAQRRGGTQREEGKIEGGSKGKRTKRKRGDEGPGLFDLT